MKLVKTYIRLKGQNQTFPFHLSGLILHETFLTHHTFELQAVVPNGEETGLEDLQTVLGAYIELELADTENDHRRHIFSGLVDRVSCHYLNGAQMVKIEGFSPTVLMDSGPRFRAFTGESLQAITEKVLPAYQRLLHFPECRMDAPPTPFAFTVQCQESDYDYLRRISDEMGVNFYYDGQAIHLDDLLAATSERLSLTLGVDLEQLEASVNLCPLRTEVRAYDLVKDQFVEYPLQDDLYSNNRLLQVAMNNSSCYPTPRISLPFCLSDKNELKRFYKQVSSRQTNELLSIHGKSNRPELAVGTTVTFVAKKAGLPGLSSQDPFKIVEVRHLVEQDGSYYNTFTAVPADLPFALSAPAASPPSCGPLVATVTDNNDPEKLGRVKVSFDLDDMGAPSPWLRVLRPYSGYDGFFFTPEIGEKTVVLFDDFHPEKSPFVIGAFFYGGHKAERWSDKQNLLKGIGSKKASIQFDDRSGQLIIRASSIALEAEGEMKLQGGKQLKLKANRIDLN